MDKIRMRVLEAFTRNLDGQIISGDPDHTDENGRFVTVSPGAALVLERDKIAEQYSEKDQLRDELAEEKRLAKLTPAERGNPDGSNPGGASTQGIAPEKSAQQVRAARTDTATGRKAGTKAADGRRAPGAKGGAPAGGNDTNASTNSPTTSTTSNGGTGDLPNAGAVTSEPDPDAPPA